MANRPTETIDQITTTMTAIGFDYQTAIDGFGQVAAFEARESGKGFTLRDHARGLILAQLSNQRPWGPIADNLDALTEVYLGFEPGSLKAADPRRLAEEVKALRCGNRQIGKQCEHLKANIETLERIGTECESVDAFITADAPEAVARRLADPGPTKLKQMGFTLAMEYLRNVGINVVKPDLHICRIIGPERLGLVDYAPTPEQAYEVLMEWAQKTGRPVTWIDNVLWLFAARDYAAVCTATPRCAVCQVVGCRSKDE